MPVLELNQRVALNYQVDGSGERAFLLFNGAALPLEFWGSAAESLTSIGRVIRFDQRNAGKTEFDGVFSLLDVCQDAAALLDHLKCKQVTVIGHAWGGRAAQVFARDYPHRVTQLVICGTGGQLPAVDTQALDRELRQARRSEQREDWQRAIARRWFGQQFAAREPDTFHEICDLLWSVKAPHSARWDPEIAPSASYWGTSQVPTLLLYGSEDKNGTPANGQDLQRRIKGSAYIEFPGTGHFLVRESREVINAIKDFVSH